MALQIRRGPTAERLAVTFLKGEIVFDTDLNEVFVGDDVTPGGRPVTVFTDKNAIDAVAESLLSGTGNVTFTYDEELERISASVTLDGGLINIVEDTSPQLGGDLDLNTNMIAGVGEINITGNITSSAFFGPLTGDVTGNVSGSAATVTESSQTAITEVGTLTSLSVTGSVDASSFTGNIVTSSITSTGSADITVTPKVIFSDAIDVTLPIEANGGVISVGSTEFNTTVGNIVTINLDESTASAPTRISPLILNTIVNGTQGSEFSGPSVEFSVQEDINPPLSLSRIVSFDGGEEGGEWRVELWDRGQSTFDPVIPTVGNGSGGVRIAAIPAGVVFNNTLLVSKNGFFTHRESALPQITQTDDLTLYPDINSGNAIITYGHILPGTEGVDPVEETPTVIPSGSFDLGSPSSRYRNAYLSGGLVTLPPTNSFGKPGDVAGAVAFDGEYIYRCTAGYTDGSTQIWTRASLTFATW